MNLRSLPQPAPVEARPWLNAYPDDVEAVIDTDLFPSLVALLETSFGAFSSRPAFRFMGKDLTYADLDAQSRDFAAFLQARGLRPGDRVAVMLPNVLEYPVAVAGILRAGLVVVNVNPLYTPRELAHQLQDAGCRAIVIFDAFAPTLRAVMSRLPAMSRIVVVGHSTDDLADKTFTEADGPLSGGSAADPLRWRESLAQGRGLPFSAPVVAPDDIAVLQYTGGTTGVSKGAVLLHRNLVANVLQSEAWYQPALRKIPVGEPVIMVSALPLYHIFGFCTNMMLGLRMGGCNVLIPNARDTGAMLAQLSRERFHCFPGVNTLFSALGNHPAFRTVDWSHLRLSIGGGMAVQSATARLWLEQTGCPICEGYGLSETSPVATCNPVDTLAFSGTIGLPLPNTDVMLVDDAGREVPRGQAGEIAIRGPQVMHGYWQRPEETANVMTAAGYFRTGDVGVMDNTGYFRIVDRKKDMILVSGFNVYPSEVEDVITQMADVVDCAVVGVPDEKAGEAVKAVVVRKHPHVSEDDIRRWCEKNLTGYKRPKLIEFRSELPRSAVGKVLRRELRDAPGAP